MRIIELLVHGPPPSLERALSTISSAGMFEDGIRQVVTLGAGFDCRFYRLQELGSVAGFEVDQPSTLALKISRLRTLLEKATTNVRFVAIDFEHQKLADRLRAEGFDRRQPAIFIWEGVTNYLTAEAVDAVL